MHLESLKRWKEFALNLYEILFVKSFLNRPELNIFRLDHHKTPMELRS
jgi:hypothetical protein